MIRPLFRAALPFALLLFAALPAEAGRKKKAPDDGLPSVDEVIEKAREVFKDLTGNSNPLVRRAVFAGLLELEDADRVAAVESGLKESDWVIREQALGLAMKGKGKALRAFKKDALAAVDALLESGEEEDRAHGLAIIEAHFSEKDQIRALQGAAKKGTPEARAAGRAALRARGGKIAWAVITAGLNEPSGEPEHKEAVEALRTFSDPVALKWAREKLHDATFGELARGVLSRIEGKAGAKLEKALKKEYDKSADFETRLRIASVLARRGDVASVSRTLHAGLRYNKPAARVIAWEGLVSVRDVVLLGKLREKIVTNERDAEADLAYAWMEAWAKTNAEPKVIEILQEVARSDRRGLRLRALGVLTTIKHRPSAPIFESAMSEGQTEVRLAAARGLAAVARAGDEQRLAKYLRKEPSAEVKEALIEGLANIGTADIIGSLQFVITSPQKSLKLGAAKAVAATGSPKAITLMGLLKRDPDLDVRFLAWQVLLRQKPETFSEFKGGALSWLTPAQVEALGADPKIQLEVIEFIGLEGGDDQRPYAVKALTGRGAAASTRLLSLIDRGQHNEDTAAAALAALAEQRKNASFPTYLKATKSKYGAIRAAGYSAIRAHGSRRFLEQVLGGLADKDPLARAEAARAAVQIAARVDE